MSANSTADSTWLGVGVGAGSRLGVGVGVGLGVGFEGRLDHAARAVAVEGEDACRERAVIGAWLGSGLGVSVRVRVGGQC